MKMLARGNRGAAALAALLTMAVTAMITDAAMAGGRMNNGHGAYAAPPYYAGPARPRGSNVQVDGSSVSFSSGGSGTKPTKKPNLQ
jgi:hypothetical protein